MKQSRCPACTGTHAGNHDHDSPAPATLIPPPIATSPLGCCYHCVTARRTDPARHVAQAITLAPVSVQISDQTGQTIGIAIVALPHCAACLSGTGSRLITA